MVAAGAGAVFRRIPVVGGIVAPIAAQVKDTSHSPCSSLRNEVAIISCDDILLFGFIVFCMIAWQGSPHVGSPVASGRISYCRPVFC